MEQETLDKEQVAAVFEPLRRRPNRPAWTGSPDRNPSNLPPVSIPEKILAAAAEGAGALTDDDQKGAVILTPPGSGGDVHGDPGLNGPKPSTPPTPGGQGYGS
jgi:cell division protease FtsH